MPWREVSIMDERGEFVRLAGGERVNRQELFRRFGISAKTGYKWLGRATRGEGLADRSRRPGSSPARSEAALETAVLEVRDAHPAWGARKIAHCLKRAGTAPPAYSTVHAILVRHGRVVVPADRRGPAPLRFERAAPNELWQMDFKGWKRLADGVKCHSLTVVDDHSRYALCLKACADQRRETVQDELTATFKRFGLPDAMIVDNGSPWGDGPEQGWTRLGVWLLKLGIDVLHSRIFHPQTRGKNERFHSTLEAEVFALERFRGLADVQRAFERWRLIYNLERPHQALDYEVPMSRYRASPRTMPDRLPEPHYAEGETLRTVGTTSMYVSFKGRRWKVPQAFRGERVAIRPRGPDGHYAICFGAHEIAEIDLAAPKPQPVTHVPEQVLPMSPV